jgi:hypothetical protein
VLFPSPNHLIKLQNIFLKTNTYNNKAKENPPGLPAGRMQPAALVARPVQFKADIRR